MKRITTKTLSDYTEIIIETKEEPPKLIARITPDTIAVDSNYKLSTTSSYLLNIDMQQFNEYIIARIKTIPAEMRMEGFLYTAPNGTVIKTHIVCGVPHTAYIEIGGRVFDGSELDRFAFDNENEARATLAKWRKAIDELNSWLKLQRKGA